MVRLNVFSVIFYTAMLWVSYKGWLTFFAPMVYIEVVVHMCMAILLTGWENEFQISLIGINVLAFYAEYVGRTLKMKIVPMLPFAVFGVLSYLGSFLYEHYHPAPYTLTHEVQFILILSWGILVCGINVVVLQLLVLIADNFQKKLEYQMSHDELTTLPNRYLLTDYLEKIEKNEGLSNYFIAISDIDDFKSINDTYGHHCGDYVLTTLAGIAEKEEGLMCFRWGGEEFIYIGKMDSGLTGRFDSGISGKTGQDSHLPGKSNHDSPFAGKSSNDSYLSGKSSHDSYLPAGIDEARQQFENFRKKVEEYPFTFRNQVFTVTLTIGLAAYEPGLSVDDWLNRADHKMYKGKNNGKNQVVV